ncbi:MAG TPA: spermidine synthase [Desulfonatronum sp.]|nr:spermidine synthase [Desulfonatronum sp.]
MLELTVFLCGGVVMILELTGSRILAPYLGTSLVVWTGLIGVVLGALSLGYWWGGRIADQKPTLRVLSLIVMAAGAAIGLAALVQAPLLRMLQKHVLNLHLGVLLSTVLLFGPASILLGMIAPYAVKMKLSCLEYSGATVGRMYALSTIGSIAGTFLAGFVLLSFFGSLTILIFLGLLMTALALVLAPRAALVPKVLLLLVLVLGGGMHLYHQRALVAIGWIDVDTPYNRIIVAPAKDEITDRRMRIMTTGPGWFQSAMYLDDPVELVLPYTRFFRLGEHFSPRFQRVLMIGGGGYSFPKYLQSTRADMELDVVEIDPGFTDLAKSFFAFEPDQRVRVHHQDARRFLNQHKQPYDLIILDAFNSHYSIPFQLTTRQAASRMSASLTKNGVLIMNLISAIHGKNGRFLRAQLATLESVFPRVLLFPVTHPEDPYSVQNIVLVALKANAEQEMIAATDELNSHLAHLWQGDIPRDMPVLMDSLAPVERYLPTGRY